VVSHQDVRQVPSAAFEHELEHALPRLHVGRHDHAAKDPAVGRCAENRWTQDAIEVAIATTVVQQDQLPRAARGPLAEVGLEARFPVAVAESSRAGRDGELVGNERDTPELFAAIVQIGARTADPMRDVDAAVVDSARRRLRDAGVDPDAARPLDEVVTATFVDVSRAFGEPLPNGLRLGGDAASYTDLKNAITGTGPRGST